jgi:synaptic vesicle membrane protein VAT-1
MRYRERSMKQVWITRAGGPEVLEVREAPNPEPAAGEVVIEVTAAGLNFADILARMGLYPDAPKLPTVVGYEVAGMVAALGQGVGDLAAGTRVLALTRFGGHSSVVAVPRRQVVELPDGLSVQAAAAIPVTYLTAWLMLVRLGNLQRGERVLIHAAAGGVGQAAVQLARWRGAEIFGTASASKHETLREAGVEHCIDYRNQDFEEAVRELTGGKGVHLVVDAVGGSSFRKSYRLLAPMGRLFMFGVSSMAPGERRSIPAAIKGLASMPRFRAIPLMNENRGVFGINLGHLWDEAEAMMAMMDEILALTRDGVLEPVIDRTFPFEEAAAAHRYLQDRKNIGKVLLTP